jgi:restriction system protein
VARRKSKRKQEEDFVQGIAGLVLAGSFFGTLMLTKSIGAAFGVTAVAFAAMIAVMIMMHMNRMDRLRRSGITDIDKMDWRQFEIYLGELFKKHGYETKVTQGSGDYGADVVISKGSQKVVVQAKLYSKNVGIDAVQQVIGSIKHYGATGGWVVTNRDYTEAAYSLAKSNDVRLINREQLIEMVLKMNPAGGVAAAKQAVQAAPASDKVCIKCGSNGLSQKCSRRVPWLQDVP